jgi:hypothetical protein
MEPGTEYDPYRLYREDFLVAAEYAEAYPIGWGQSYLVARVQVPDASSALAAIRENAKLALPGYG